MCIRVIYLFRPVIASVFHFALDHTHCDVNNRDMWAGRQNDEIALIPFDDTNFFAHEEQHAELAAQISARQAAGDDPLLDRTYANAWYRDHPEDLEKGTRSSDEVGGW